MSKAIRLTITGMFFTILTTISVLARSTEDDALNTFFKNYLEEYFQQQPLQATSLGDHRFDSQLDDISPKARAG